MKVVAHGDVDAFCKKHDMRIVERYNGKLEDYAGRRVIVVTDNCSDKFDYYFLKYKFSKQGVVLFSTHWEDKDISDFVDYLTERLEAERRQKYTGRRRFGETLEEQKVLQEIYRLRDEGYTLKRISETVRYPDGRKIGISSIQLMLKNRERYGL